MTQIVSTISGKVCYTWYMSATFISYRRNDSAGHTGRLYDHLCESLGEGNVFRDIDTIKPGSDFVDAVQDGIKHCSTLVVVIGNHWLTAEDESGRRLDHPLDYVRLEISSALKQGIQVLPVLVEGARMPDPTDLPEDIAPLARRQALQLSDDRWDYDVSRLISALTEPDTTREYPQKKDAISTDDITAIAAHHIPSDKNTFEKKNKSRLISTLVLLMILSAGLVIWLWPGKQQPPTSSKKIEEKTLPIETKEIVVIDTDSVKIERKWDESVTIEAKEAKQAKQAKEVKEVKEVKEIEVESIQLQNEITLLLDRARENINRLQLTSPKEDNAVEKYRRILELQPGHTEALHGLEQVSRTYADLATKAAEGNEFNKADSYLNQARSIKSDIPAIRQVEQLISSLRQRQEQAEKSATNREQKEVQSDLQSLEQEQSRLSCESGCKNKALQCEQKAQTIDCSMKKTQTQCDDMHNECLRDPQTLLTWGELGAAAECLGIYNQCKEQQLKACETSQSKQLTKCQTNLDSCLTTC